MTTTTQPTRKPRGAKREQPCPVCGLPVEIGLTGTVNDHQRFGARRAGVVTTVPCAGAGTVYIWPQEES